MGTVHVKSAGVNENLAANNMARNAFTAGSKEFSIGGKPVGGCVTTMIGGGFLARHRTYGLRDYWQ